jgi:hypothetical protein
VDHSCVDQSVEPDKEAPDGFPEASGCDPRLLLDPAQQRGGRQHAFKAIPAETAVKRGFSFSTGRREAAGALILTQRILINVCL